MPITKHVACAATVTAVVALSSACLAPSEDPPSALLQGSRARAPQNERFAAQPALHLTALLDEERAPPPPVTAAGSADPTPQPDVAEAASAVARRARIARRERRRTWLQEWWWTTLELGDLPRVRYELGYVLRVGEPAWPNPLERGWLLPKPLPEWADEVCLPCHDANYESEYMTAEEVRREFAIFECEPLSGTEHELFVLFLRQAAGPWPQGSEFTLEDTGQLWVRQTPAGHLRIQRFLRTKLFCCHAGTTPDWHRIR